MKKWLSILLALAVALSMALAGLAENGESGSDSASTASESASDPPSESKPKSDPPPSKPSSGSGASDTSGGSANGGGSGSGDTAPSNPPSGSGASDTSGGSANGGGSGSGDTAPSNPPSDSSGSTGASGGGGTSDTSNPASGDGGAGGDGTGTDPDGGSGTSTDGGSGTGDGSGTSTGGGNGSSTDGGSGTSTGDGSGSSTDGDSGTSTDGGNGTSTDGGSATSTGNADGNDPETGGDTPNDPPDNGDGETPDTPGGGDPSDPDVGDEPGDALTAEQVCQVQTWLNKLGYLTASQITGTYDDATRDAVMRFQADNGLPVTGECGASTFALLAQKAAEADGEGGEGETPGGDPESGSGGRPGGFPHGFSGKGRGWRGRRSRAYKGGVGGSGQTDAPEDDPLNGIVPGRALTTSHSRGDRDDALYGSIDPESIAMLADYGLSIALSAGESEDALSPSQIAEVLAEETRLSLDGGAGAVQSWTLDGLTLRTLSRSGIDELTLTGEGGSVTLPTSIAFSGSVYTALRTRGRTDNTFEYTILLAGAEPRVTVFVDGTAYRADAVGGALELIDISGEGGRQ